MTDTMANEISAGHPPAWLARDAVAYHASVRPNHLACLEFKTGERVTYRELDRLIAKCAGWLFHSLGEPLGVRVAILARNSINFIVLHYACERVGAIFQPLNWRLSGPELQVLAQLGEPQLFIYEQEFERQAREAVSGLSAMTVEISPEEDRFRSAIDASDPAVPRPAGPDAPCTLLSTSGTTGKPKGVIVTRRNAFFGGFNFASVGQIQLDSVLLCDLPTFHVAALYSGPRATLFCGATLCIADSFAAEATLQRLSDPNLGITHYFLVPQIAQTLIEDPAFRPAHFPRLEAIFTGGAPVPQILIERYVAAGIPLINGFGMSETGPVFTMPIDLEAIGRKPLSAGPLAPAVEARVVDRDGNDVKPGDAGEVWLRGPGVTPGYWNQPDATRNAFADGWFKTGDAARQDDDGFYQLIDRWKDMYITGGENVYPAEVESVLAAVQGVADAAVIGVPDPRWGESGCAYIVLDAGAAVTAEEILSHCSARLARYKHPSRFLFVEALPRNAGGKVKKDILRRQFEEVPSGKR
jgi:fatty-acyl-CoA synthase